MTYALKGRGMGALPSGWDTWAPEARVVDIHMRASILRGNAAAMSAEVSRFDTAAVAIDAFPTVAGLVRSIAMLGAQTMPPVQVVRATVLIGIAQIDRLAQAAVAAALSTLSNKSDFSSGVRSARNDKRLHLAAEALSTAEMISTALMQIFRAIHAAQSATSGMGETEEQIFAVALGLLFAPYTGGITFYAGLLYALTDLFGLADELIAKIEVFIGHVLDSAIDVAKEVARPVGKAVGVWLGFVLIGGSVVAALYFGIPWLAKKAASKAANTAR